jgi:hypothetical protein
MRRPLVVCSILAAVAALLVLAGCPSTSTQGPPDVAADTSGPGDVHGGEDAQGDPDVAAPDQAGPPDLAGGDDARVPPPDAVLPSPDGGGPDALPAPELRCAVVTAGGDLSTDAGRIVLSWAHEPAAHGPTPGFQVGLRATLAGAPDGLRARLTLSGALVAEQDLRVDPVSGEGVARFEGVTLPYAPDGLPLAIALVAAGGDQPLSSCAGILVVDLGLCPVELLPAPAAGCLGADEDPAPGYQRRFTVRSDGRGCDRASLVFQVGSEPLETPTVLLEDGAASFLLTLYASAIALNNESVTVTARVTDAVNPARAGRSPSTVYTIDTEAPSVTIEAPAGEIVTTADDLDGNPANGIQFAVAGRVGGVTPADGAALVLSVDGVARGEAVVSANGSFAFAPVTFGQERAYDLSVRATDTCGATGVAERTVRARTVAPTVACAVATRTGERDIGAGPVVVGLSDEPLEYVGTPGLQLDLIVRTTRVEDGAAAVLRFGGEALAAATVAADPATGAGVALFAGVTVPHTPAGAALEVAVATPDRPAEVATCAGRLVVDLGPCPVEVRPVPGACLRADEDPAAGFQRRFTVRSVGGWCDQAWLLFQTAGEPVRTQAVALDAGGAAEFLVTLFPTTVALDNETVLVVGVAGDSAAPDREAQSPARIYTVDTQPPRVTIAEPSSPVVTLAADADGNPANGLQLAIRGRAAGVVPDDGAAVSLSVDDAVVAETTTDPDGYWSFPPYTFMTSGTYALTVAASDTCGGHGEATKVIRVETVVPSLAIVAPRDGARLLARDDGDRGTPLVFELAFTVRAEDVVQGTALTLRCGRDEPGAPLLDAATYAIVDVAPDARYEVPVALRTDLLGTAQLCTVSTDGPNPAASAATHLTVALPAPRLTLAAPADGLLTNADEIVVAGAAAHLDGRALEVRLEDGAGASLVTVTSPAAIGGGVFTATLPFDGDPDPVPDGTYRVVVDALDALGNRAADQPESVVAASVTIDRTAPALALTWPPTGGLNPGADPAAADSDPLTPGYQADVVVALSGEPDAAAATVCLGKDGAALGCVAALPGAEPGAPAVAVFAGVTFQPGANGLVVTATDAAGNAAEALVAGVALALDAPRVTIVAPEAGLTTLDGTADVVVEVTDVAGIGPIDGATVVVEVGGTPSSVAAAPSGPGRYRFAAVPLAPGRNVLRARATAGGTEGASDPRTVTWKTERPVVAITAPVDGAVLRAGGFLCAAGETDCRLSVRCSVADAEERSPARLAVDCGRGVAAYETASAGDKAEFEDVVLAHGATCALAVTLTDTVGQVATAGPIAVTVDRVPPRIVDSDLPPVLQFDADRGAQPGMQVALSVTLDGVEAGQLVAVRATNERGGGRDYSVPVPLRISEGAPAAVALGTLTLPEGFVEVTIDVSDAAGNPAPTLRRAVYVDSDVPDVRLLLPEYVPAAVCATNADCDWGGACSPSGCARAWGAAATFVARVSLLGVAPGGESLRICSDHPVLAEGGAAACATPGFFEVVRVATGGVGDQQQEDVSLEGLLAEGFQVLVAEAETLPGNGQWVSSAANPLDLWRERPVFVDTVPPVLLRLAAADDVEAPPGVLNAAEQAAAGRGYRLQLAASEPADVTVHVNGAPAGTVDLPTGEGALVATLAEGTNAVQARVTDRVGNPSALLPEVPFAPVVDTVPPTLSFLYPEHSPVIAGESQDVSLRSDAIGQMVTLFDGGVALGTAPVAPGGLVLFVRAGFPALDDGVHTLTAEVRDPAGNPRTAATVPATILVDTVPPEVAVAAPAPGAVFTDADDAAPAAGGFQVAVRFTPSGAASWRVALASGCDATFAGCGAPVEHASGPAGALPTEVALMVTVPLAGATTHHVLDVVATDEHGNATHAAVPFTVELVECFVSLAGIAPGGVYHNALCAGAPGADCATVAGTLTVSYALSCVGVDEVALYRGGVRWATAAADGDLRSELPVLFAHGEAYDLSARVLAGGVPVGDSGATPIRVDLRDPLPRFVAASVDGFVTAASGSSVLYGAGHDQDTLTPAVVDVHVRLTVSDDGGLVDGAVQSLVRVTDGVTEPLVPTNTPLPRPIPTSPWSGDFKFLALPEGAHTIVATVRDKAGNVATTQFAATIDNVAPVIASIDLPEVLLRADDLRPADAGMQVALVVTLEGVEAGQPVAVRATNTTGAVLTYELALPTGVPEGAPAAVGLGLVTLPEGTVTVTIDVRDTAGNAALQAAKTLYVTSLAPAVRISLPTRVPNDPCTSSAQCASGGVCTPSGCATGWNAAATPSLRLTVEGVAPGTDDVRVCSDHPSLVGGAACATAGTYELARGSYPGGGAGVTVDVPVAATLPEGFQMLVAEVELRPGGGAWARSVDDPSSAVRRRHVYRDTVVPSVAQVSLPGDVAAPAGVLNSAEQAEAGRRYVVRVTATEDGLARIRLNGALAATVPVTGGAAQATIAFAEGANQVQADVSDLVGNTSALAPAPALSATVDTVAPTLSFVWPDRSPLLAGDPLDVRLRSDALGRSVTLSQGGAPVGTALVAGDGSVTFAHATFHALDDGARQLSAAVSDAAGNPAVAVTSPAVIDVDTTPPVIVVAAPVASASFADGDDADPAQGGFQVAVRFTPTGAVSWTLALQSGCDAAFAGCGAPVELESGAAADVEVARVVTTPVTDETSYFRLVVTARDALGNGTTVAAPFAVVLQDCVVTVDGLPAGGTYANALCPVAGSDCDSVPARLTARYTFACVGTDAVALYKSGVAFATSTTIVNQTAVFDVTFAHGETFDLSARALAGGATAGDSGPNPVRVDLRDPAPLFVAAVVGGFPTAASGSVVRYGRAADQQPATPATAEVPVRLTATDDGGLVGGQVVSLVRVTGGVPTALAPTNVTLPYAIAAAPLQVDLFNLPLPAGGPHVVRAAVRDKAGNLATTDFTVTVDLTAPAIATIDLPDHLDWTDDLDPVAADVQVEVLVTLAGVEAGQEVRVVASGETVAAYDVALAVGVPDGAPTQVSLGELTLPKGTVTVTADVADAAGNPAPQASHELYVNPDRPDVRMVLPTRIPNVACVTNADCATGGVCTPSGCAAPWSAASTLRASVGLLGIAPGTDTLRICSSHPALAANPACAAAGYHVLETVDVTGESVDVILAGLVPQGFQFLIAEAEPWPGGGGWVSSLDNLSALYQRRAVYVDTVVPAVATLTSPSDVEAPTGTLNIAEQAEPGRRYVIRVTATENGTAQLWVNGVNAATVPIVGGAAQATVTLLEGPNSVQAVVSDLVGNSSGLQPATPYAPLVDTLAPTLVFLSPDHSPVLAGDPLDVRLSSNAAAGRLVSLYDGGVLVGTAPVDGGVATFPHASFHALSDGSHTLTAAVRDAANNPRTAATSPATIQVDTIPPGLVVAAPATGALLRDADDADPVAGGYQVVVRFTPTGAATWSFDLASGCDAAHAGCGAPVGLGAGAAAGVEVTQVVAVPLADPTTYHRLGVEARDALGNGTRREVPFTVQLTDCVVSLSGLPVGGKYNNTLCATNPGQNCASVADSLTVTFTTACVGTDTLALYKDGAELAATAEIVNQSATFDVTFANGESFSLSARAREGAVTVGDSGGTPVLVDLHDPVPLFVAADVDGFTTPATGETVLYGIAQDQQPASTGSVEIHVRLTATDTMGLAGGRVSSIARGATPLQPSNVTLPYTIPAGPFALDLKNLPLPDGGPYTVRVTVTDAAGNSATTAFVATADTVRPAAVALEEIPASDVHPRRPSVTVRWPAVADNGATGAAAARYQVRYSYAPIASDAAFDAACDVADLVPGLPLPTPAAPGTPEEFTLDGPDARPPDDPCRLVTTLDPRPIYVAVKALDAAGNASPLGVDSVRSTSDVHLRWTTIGGDEVTIASQVAKEVWAIGDLDGDGLQDMALSYMNMFGPGWVCVVYGHADDPELTVDPYVLDGPERAAHVCLSMPLGWGSSIASATDLNADGLDDLVVGGGGFTGGVRVYFGVAAGHIAATPNVTVSGARSSAPYGLQVENAGDFDGDGVADLVLEAGTEYGPEGRRTGAVYILPGNAAWNAATNLAVNVTNAGNRTTHRIARIAVQGTNPGAGAVNFGYRVAGVGNLLPDGGGAGPQYDDVAITQRLTTNTVYVVKGRPLVGAVNILVTDLYSLPSPAAGEDLQVLRLRPEAGVTGTNFGTTLLATDLDGDGVRDVIVAHPKGADEGAGYSIYVFDGAKSAPRVGTPYVRVGVPDPYSLSGDARVGAYGVILPGPYQQPVLLGDFDDEGGHSPDLALRMRSDTQWGEVYVRLGLRAFGAVDGFPPFEDLVVDHPSGSGALGFGMSMAGVGDVNGDGYPDILVGGDPAQGAPAAILIY